MIWCVCVWRRWGVPLTSWHKSPYKVLGQSSGLTHNPTTSAWSQSTPWKHMGEWRNSYTMTRTIYVGTIVMEVWESWSTGSAVSSCFVMWQISHESAFYHYIYVWSYMLVGSFAFADFLIGWRLLTEGSCCRGFCVRLQSNMFTKKEIKFWKLVWLCETWSSEIGDF